GTSAALRDARIVATQVAGERAMPAASLAARWRAARPGAIISAVEDVAAALDGVVTTAPGPVVVAGSLYLVGEARRRWVDDA
ncbi:MAG TPA: hypothetical protein VFI15_02465, partial [Candidatus Limnocylindrales bacterium]|nr:hypothetical protein [Candidatus Limnocylindrales bacterium]